MIMASSSSSSAPQLQYDVFVSFRREDTNRDFIDLLSDAFCQEKIKFFIQYQPVGREILKSIETSKISVIVFSENYAGSESCLQELEYILECKRMFGQTVIPTFCGVDPSNVKNLTGAFGDSFSKLQKRCKERIDELKRWKDALVEAAHLPRSFMSQSLLVESTVGNILERLHRLFPHEPLVQVDRLSPCEPLVRVDRFSPGEPLVGVDHLSPSVHEPLVGVESSIQEIESLLCIGSDNVKIVGIWGIGGIGKTTIARAVFDKVSGQFERACFFGNVREESQNDPFLTHLRQKFVFTMLGDRYDYSFLGKELMRERLSRLKILVVFDDVTNRGQIEMIVGDFTCFGLGSRIIITTRDKQVLQNCPAYNIYEVEGLSNVDAFQLFIKHAFGNNFPTEDYLELLNKVVGYAKGVPLALEVLGCYLHARPKEFWVSAIEKLVRFPPKDIQNVLKISFDGLDYLQKDLFLDIAFFFKGWKAYLVRDILKANGLSMVDLFILIDKALISISNDNITMHDLIQEMGMEIVRGESHNPDERSRLCHHEDIYGVFRSDMRTKRIEGMCLDMSRVDDIHLHPHAFRKMPNLRFLKLHCSNKEDSRNKVHGFQEFDLTRLTYLHWHGFPLQSFSSTASLRNLIVLGMPYSNVRQLWDGSQHLFCLKHINLSYSRKLSIVPDLSQAKNLESLILQGCTSLIEIHSFIQNLSNLVILNLSDCESLNSLPTEIRSERLINVILSGCSNLKKAPRISCNVKRLYLKGTSIEELPLIENPSRLVVLDLENCSKLEKLPSSICELKFLEYLTLSGCSKLDKLPYNLGNLEALLYLEAKDTAIAEIPSSIEQLKRLHKFSLSQMEGQAVAGLVLPPLSGLSFLTILDLSYCQITNLPDSISSLSSLEWLSLTGNNFETIPESIKYLSDLFFLDLSYCERLQSLPELPKGLNMQVRSCSSLEELSDLSFLFSTMSRGQKVNLANCFKLNQSALKTKVEAALPGIQHKEFYRQLSGTVYFPGSEIPEWFKFQTVGSYIELPPGWINKNFLGFALCVVVTFRDHHIVGEDFFVRCICKTKSEDGEVEERHGLLDAWDSDGQDYVGSDHVFLGFHFYMCEPIDDRYC